MRRGEQTFAVEFVRVEQAASDNSVARYDDCKLSILLTDGLAAVFDDKVLNPGSGSILFFHPDDVHFGRFLRDGTHEYMNFYFSSDCFYDYLGESALLPFSGNARSVHPPADIRAHLIRGAREIESILREGDSDSAVYIFAYLLRAIHLCRKLADQEQESHLPPSVSSTLAFLSEHYAERISLSALARSAGCSTTYLSRSFRAYTGTSVYEHLIDLRISEACRRLKSGMNVTETCFSVGFEDCSNFIRAFRKKIGKTPLQYQKA